MKKVLSVILVLALIASVGCVAAFAAGSTEWFIAVTGEKNAKLTDPAEMSPAEEAEFIKALEEEIAKAIEELDEDGQKAFEAAGFDYSKVNATVALLKNAEVESEKIATMDVITNGIEDITVAAFNKNADGEIELLGVGEPPMSIEMDESGLLIITIIR